MLYCDVILREGYLGRLLFVIVSFLAIVTMVNAPGIGYGYGLIILAMILASWLYNPFEAFLYLFISHIIATFVVLETRSAFLLIFALSNMLRPILAALGSYLKGRYGKISSSLTIVALDAIIALTIAVTYYGDDGIHAAFSLYEFIWIPFAYIIYESLQRKERTLGLIATAMLSFSYMASIFAFLSITTFSLTIIGFLIVLYAIHKGLTSRAYYVAVIAIVIIGLLAGGLPLKLNLKTMSYPFSPKSYSNYRWSISSKVCGNFNNVFEGVHDPARLRIVRDCITLTGKVEALPIRFDDGDYCFDLKVINSTYPVSIGGHILRHGHVHVEIIPKDQPGLLNRVGGGLCPGDVIKVTGVYVIDTDHGLWSEVHPVLSIDVINKTGSWPQCVWSYVREKAEEYSNS